MKRWLLLLMIAAVMLGCCCPLSGKGAFAAMVYTETYTTPQSTSTKKVVILVHSSIYDALFTASLKQFIADLEAEEYNVTLVKFTSGTPAELKDYLKLFLPDIKGAIMIGNLPVARFENAQDFSGYAQFPCDLFYMEVDTPWIDSNGNGIYDTIGVSTDQAIPKIWIGRLMTSPIQNPSMDEVLLLKNYFAKNHAYRTGGFSIAHRALSYIDDDWSGGSSYLQYAYGNVDEIKDKAVTIAADYKNRLVQSYEWIHVWVHSNAVLHRFKLNGTDEHDVTYSDILALDPKTLFYNLFACSSAHFLSTNNLAGHYTFAPTNGLLTIGSTKTGSMLSPNYLYANLAQNLRKTIGEAFTQWFNITGKYTISWHYGMVIVGDPTLGIDPPIAIIDSIESSGQSVTFRGSGRINAGQITEYKWRSDKDGFLSSNSEFSSSSLSRGQHVIYLKVKDVLGRWSSEAAKILTVGVSYGDVSGDGRVSAYDAALAVQYAIGLITFTPAQITQADVSGDGSVSAYDAALIVQYAVGLIDKFPVE